MNLCFLGGRIQSEINFNFIMRGKKYSIVEFLLELFDGTMLHLKVYDDIADYMYKSLQKR